MAKDLFLVEAALATDGIIVSRDDVAREYFRRAAAETDRLKSVIWVNPATDDLSLWLEGKGKPTPSMKLGGRPKEESRE